MPQSTSTCNTRCQRASGSEFDDHDTPEDGTRSGTALKHHATLWCAPILPVAIRGIAAHQC